MKYYHELYVSQKLELRKNEILFGIQRGKIYLNKYLIVLSANPKNQLEIFDSVLVSKSMLPVKDLFVVGLTDGFDEALSFIEMLTQEVVSKTGVPSLREYIMQRQREFEERNR